MFAMSFPQPMAALVAAGIKRLETRPYGTAWRGILAIHASEEFPPENRQLCRKEPYRSFLAMAGVADPDRLPTGAIVGFCYLEHVAVIQKPITLPPTEPPVDLTTGRFLYLFSGAVPLSSPIPLPSGHRVWRVPLPNFPWNAVSEQVMAQRAFERQPRQTPLPSGLQVVEGDLWQIGGPDAWRVVTTSLARRGRQALAATPSGSEAVKRLPWLPEWYEEQRKKGRRGVLVCREEGTRLVLFPEQPETAAGPHQLLAFIALKLKELNTLQKRLGETIVMPVPGLTGQPSEADLRVRLKLVSQHLGQSPVTVVLGQQSKGLPAH